MSKQQLRNQRPDGMHVQRRVRGDGHCHIHNAVLHDNVRGGGVPGILDGHEPSSGVHVPGGVQRERGGGGGVAVLLCGLHARGVSGAVVGHRCVLGVRLCGRDVGHGDGDDDQPVLHQHMHGGGVSR